MQKSYLQPTQQQPYLGAILNTNRFSLSQCSQNSQVSNTVATIPKQPISNSKNFHATSSDDGIIQCHSTSCKIKHASSTGMPGTTMESITGSTKRSSVGRQYNPSLSAVVEHPTPVKREALNQPCSISCAHIGSIPYRMWWPSTTSNSSGSLGHQTQKSPHQLPRASSCSPSAQSIFTSPDRESCLCTDGQYDRYVL